MENGGRGGQGGSSLTKIQKMKKRSREKQRSQPKLDEGGFWKRATARRESAVTWNLRILRVGRGGRWGAKVEANNLLLKVWLLSKEGKHLKLDIVGRLFLRWKKGKGKRPRGDKTAEYPLQRGSWKSKTHFGGRG